MRMSRQVRTLNKISAVSVWVWVACWLLGTHDAQARHADLPRSSPESVGFSSERLKRLDAMLERAVDEKQCAGVVALLARHGKVVYFAAKGKSDLASSTPVAPDTLFRLASMTKPLTGTAMMLLYEEGKWT